MILVDVLCATAMAGSPIPGRWDKVEQLSTGVLLEVRLKSGDRVEGTFLRAQGPSLSIVGDNGVLTYPRDEVALVTAAETRRDGIGDGALKGVAAGAVGGVALGLASWGDNGPGPLFGFTMLGTGIGAIAGALVDLGVPEVRQDEILYKAP